MWSDPASEFHLVRPDQSGSFDLIWNRPRSPRQVHPEWSTVSIANQWYKDNGMIANASKHQAMILGRTDHQFSFPVKSSLDLLGMVIDNEPNFNDHISSICKKVSSQFKVMIRFRKLVSSEILLRLHKKHSFCPTFSTVLQCIFVAVVIRINLRPGTYAFF